MAGTTASIGNFHIYRDGTEDGFYGFSPGCPVLVRQRYYGPDPIELRACIFFHDVALDFSTRQLPRSPSLGTVRLSCMLRRIENLFYQRRIFNFAYSCLLSWLVRTLALRGACRCLITISNHESPSEQLIRTARMRGLSPLMV